MADKFTSYAYTPMKTPTSSAGPCGSCPELVPVIESAASTTPVQLSSMIHHAQCHPDTWPEGVPALFKRLMAEYMKSGAVRDSNLNQNPMMCPFCPSTQIIRTHKELGWDHVRLIHDIINHPERVVTSDRWQCGLECGHRAVLTYEPDVLAFPRAAAGNLIYCSTCLRPRPVRAILLPSGSVAMFRTFENPNLEPNVADPTPAPPAPVSVPSVRGRTFVFTGGLVSMTRDQAIERVEQRGGRWSNAIRRGVDYLVVGGRIGTRVGKVKSKDAEAYKVKVISEQDFLRMLDLVDVLQTGGIVPVQGESQAGRDERLRLAREERLLKAMGKPAAKKQPAKPVKSEKPKKQPNPDDLRIGEGGRVIEID